jgi:hypothetical protein
MDRLEALIAIAQLRLRLAVLERNPDLLKGLNAMPIEIKRPIELAGLKGRLLRAQKSEQAIAITGARYDKVLDEIDELHGAHKGHVGHLEGYAADLKTTIERMVGSNGDPNETGHQDGHQSDGGELDHIGQVISSETAKP